MNIKQASLASGISSRNIRYYEQVGLLHPERDPQNDYRLYTEQDVRTLKLIRAMRTLKMPLEEIRTVLEGTSSLPEAAGRQAARLREESRRLEAAIRFCETLRQEGTTTAALDVDACLARMEAAPTNAGWFTGWVTDYRAMAQVEHRRQFTFTPDTPVTTPSEFTEALFAYARERDLDLVVTRESMAPRFTIDGIEFRATRYYYPIRGIPTARIRCEICDPDFCEADVSPKRLRLMKALHYAMPALTAAFLVLLFLLPRGLLGTWWGILLLAGCIAAGFGAAWYNVHMFYNDKDNANHSD